MIFKILNLFVFVTSFSKLGCETKVEQKPNVLMICVDDLYDWIGVIGRHLNAISPNMDKLASKKSCLQMAHCQAPICGPFRESIITGLWLATTGIYGQIHDAIKRCFGNIKSG
jgi:iduronate 2-sulfatase